MTATAATTTTTETPLTEDGEALRAQVRNRYGAIAKRVNESVTESADDSCCPSTCCPEDGAETVSVIEAAPAETKEKERKGDGISSNLYSAGETSALPEAAVLASLGCGNPTALAELRPGETVLDLGSGGGIDVLLSAKRVGPTGFAFGLDMTDEMLALAEANKAKAGAENVAFLKGTIEKIPLPSSSVDVIISNCVINLSADKPAVLREAFRVLKPGGRLAVSDVVVQGDSSTGSGGTLPEKIRRSMELWAGCIGGALEEKTYRGLLAAAGFIEVGVEVTRVYDNAKLAADDAEDDDEGCCGPSGDDQRAAFAAFDAAGGRLVSAFVRATKPA